MTTTLAGRASTVDAAGRRYVVRNGHLPPRAIQTPLGDVQVQQPRVRDRRPTDERETFRSAILPPYLRKTPSVAALYPWLYLKGISTGDFGEALQALLGPEARGLSATTLLTKTLLISALTAGGTGSGPRLVAYDKVTGEMVGSVDLPGGALGTPMTYMLDGRQYIALTVGGPVPELVAFRLVD